MPQTVAILGGGVGGLSAAHELAERGFQVTIYERKEIFGGKARSLSVPNTATGSRKDLPGEHGFRFFPAFYRHLPDTMHRIPFNGQRTVLDNLVNASRILIARAGVPSLELPARAPQRPEDWPVTLKALFGGIGVPDDELLYFIDRLLILLTSCPERRLAEYEQLPWWTFIGAERRSKEYQTLLAEGLTRSLVAMRAEDGSTRTVGYILLQLFFGILSDAGFDRLLTGPTNEVWLTPWTRYLEQRGVKLIAGAKITEIQASSAEVTGIVYEQNGTTQPISADYYVSALPVEVMAALVQGTLKEHAPNLAGLANLKVKWMNGIQLYLNVDVPLKPGHTLFADSPWALTAISQKQFWSDAALSNYGNGQVGGVLSVDISEWEKPGLLLGKPAMRCTADEIKDEVWAELKIHLNVSGKEVIKDDNLAFWFLDPDIEFPNPSGVTNLEPLLINTASSLKYRPDASTELPNLFLASDYVKTNTDIACMEAANEAARRATNALLERSGSTAPRARIWELEEPIFFEPLVQFDRVRFSLGLPHGPLIDA